MNSARLRHPTGNDKNTFGKAADNLYLWAAALPGILGLPAAMTTGGCSQTPAMSDICIKFVLLAAFCVVASTARADCNDAPQPGVDWRRCYLDGRDFAGADLSKAQLRDATFLRATMTGANFAESDAFRAKFISTRLSGAKFDSARLAEVDFTEADLSGASFRGSDLRGARFFGADLRGADLSGANLRGADFFRAQLGGALWTDGKTRCAESSISQCN